MDLQPCAQCGAVDSRVAKTCYKCATLFTPPSASEFDALVAPLAQGDRRDHSSRLEAGVAGAQAMVHAQDQPRPLNYILSSVGTGAFDGVAQPVKSRSGWLGSGVSLVAVVMATTFAIFYQRPAATVPTQAAAPVAPRVVEPSVAPPPPTALALTAVADPVAMAVSTQEPPKAPAVVHDGPANVPARAAPRTNPLLAVPPLPVADTLPTAYRAPAVLQNCSQAVATLGLCNP